jgi:hypothetical protein
LGTDHSPIPLPLQGSLIDSRLDWAALPDGLAWVSAPTSKAEVLTRKRFRLRLRLSLWLWLVAIAAAFLGGIRYGEYREAARTKPIFRRTNIVLSPAESAEFFAKAKVFTYPHRSRAGP